MKVMIVEDEVLLALETKFELNSMGCEVTGIANSSEVAIDMLSRKVPDLILMDIVIQGQMNGIELTKVVADKFPACKVIYVTAYSDETILSKVKQSRHAGIMNKPFEPYRLTQILERAS
ncbi:response regulator [Nitrospirota bacterium]